MKSVKPGRGPSFLQGFMCVAVALFGVIWTVMALSMGGGAFALFGVVFIVIAIVQAVYSFKNATSKNRFSDFDITDNNEEPDPLNEKFNQQINNTFEQKTDGGENFCPYCGAPTKDGFAFCRNCGKKLP